VGSKREDHDVCARERAPGEEVTLTLRLRLLREECEKSKTRDGSEEDLEGFPKREEVADEPYDEEKPPQGVP
jgi:hypothetical protein